LQNVKKKEFLMNGSFPQRQEGHGVSILKDAGRKLHGIYILIQLIFSEYPFDVKHYPRIWDPEMNRWVSRSQVYYMYDYNK
jgi:hypothetical protein